MVILATNKEKETMTDTGVHLTIDYDFDEEFGIAFGPGQLLEGVLVATAIQLREGGLFHVYFHTGEWWLTREGYERNELIGAVWSKSAALELVTKRMFVG